MSRQTEELLKEALKLSPEARATLAGSLIESLDDEIDKDAEEAWRFELERRMAELDSGAMRPIPWSEARKRILTLTEGL